MFWMGVVKSECGQSDHRTLKWTVFQKWTDEINYKFRKSKSWLNEFWVDFDKNGDILLFQETLKSAVSSEWIYELSWYYEINSDAIIFG